MGIITHLSGSVLPQVLSFSFVVCSKLTSKSPAAPECPRTGTATIAELRGMGPQSSPRGTRPRDHRSTPRDHETTRPQPHYNRTAHLRLAHTAKQAAKQVAKQAKQAAKSSQANTPWPTREPSMLYFFSFQNFFGFLMYIDSSTRAVTLYWLFLAVSCLGLFGFGPRH